MNATPRITCDEFDALLPDLLEETLDERARESAETHVAHCARCGGLFGDLTELRADAARLPVLKPSHDLWGAISARIETPPIAFMEQAAVLQRRARLRMIAAAAVLVAVTAAATWTVARRGVITPAAAPEVASVPVAAPTVGQAPENTSFTLVSAYEGQIAALRQSIAGHKGALDSATARVVDANLRLIDQAIARVRVALDSAPDNALLSQQLMRAYDMKLNTLRQVAALGTD